MKIVQNSTKYNSVSMIFKILQDLWASNACDHVTVRRHFQFHFPKHKEDLTSMATETAAKKSSARMLRQKRTSASVLRCTARAMEPIFFKQRQITILQVLRLELINRRDPNSKKRLTLLGFRVQGLGFRV